MAKKKQKYQPTTEPRPEMPTGTFGNTGKAETKILNKQCQGAGRVNQLNVKVDAAVSLSGNELDRPAVQPYIGSRWHVSSNLTISTIHIPIRRKSAKRDFR